MNQREFRALYDQAFPMLYRIAQRITGTGEEAEDVCIEAFAKLYERDMKFPSADEAKYWLIRVVKNASLNVAKRKAREWKAYEKSFHQTPQASEDSSKAVLREETKQEVEDLLEQLPENMRWPLILKEYGELNYKEIGRILGISEANVKVRIFRAREKLAKEAKKLDMEPGEAL
jgi:RNA polymerase sigma-70 factor (ECF subfamily)